MHEAMLSHAEKLARDVLDTTSIQEDINRVRFSFWKHTYKIGMLILIFF